MELNEAIERLTTKGDGELANPEFEKATKCHDWRNYVPEHFQNAWDEMTYNERQIVFILCEMRADQEDWD